MPTSRRAELRSQLRAQRREAVRELESTYLEWTMNARDLRRATNALGIERRGGPVFVLGFRVRIDKAATSIYLGRKTL